MAFRIADRIFGRSAALPRKIMQRREKRAEFRSIIRKNP